MKTLLLILMLTAGAASCQTIQEYESFIERWEGRRLTQYRDSEGNLTIGVGHLVTPEQKIVKKISNKTADLLLARDSVKALAIAKKLVPTFDSLPQNAKMVLVSLAFNLGEKGLGKFKKMLAAIGKEDFERAALELKDSKWWDQVGPDRKENHFRLLKSSKI